MRKNYQLLNYFCQLIYDVTKAGGQPERIRWLNKSTREALG